MTQNGPGLLSATTPFHPSARRWGRLTIALLLLVTGCPRDSVKSGAVPAFRWHFTGGANLAGSSQAPLLSNAVQIPEADGVAALVATNLLRTLAVLHGGTTQVAGQSFDEFVPLARELFTVESAGEITRNNKGAHVWALAARVDGSRLPAWQSGLSKFFGTPITVLHTNGWLLAGPGIEKLRKRAPYSHHPPERLLSIEFDAAQWPEHWWPTKAIPSPKGTLVAHATNQNVRGELRLRFPSNLPFIAEPWQIPESIIRDPIVSFTAVRGVKSLVEATEWFRFLETSTAPNQLFMWSQPTIPFRYYFGAPVPDPEAFIDQIAHRLGQLFNRPVSNRIVMGDLRFETNLHQVRIDRTPGLMPALFPLHTNGGSWVVGGFYPSARSTNPIPAELRRQLDRNGVLGFDWEDTSESLVHWRAMLQARDIMLTRGLDPLTAPGHRWLNRFATNLQEAVTQVVQTSPTDLEITRKSSVGLTGFELASLVHWLDSPFITAPGRAPMRSKPEPAKAKPAKP